MYIHTLNGHTVFYSSAMVKVKVREECQVLKD